MNKHFSEKIHKMVKYVKRCSTSFIIREMQFKTTKRYHLILVRMSFLKKIRDKKYWKRCGKEATLCTIDGNVNWCSHCGKQYESY